MKMHDLSNAHLTPEQRATFEHLISLNPDRVKNIIGDLVEGLKQATDDAYRRFGAAFAAGDTAATVKAQEELLACIAAGNGIVKTEEATSIMREEQRARGDALDLLNTLPPELRALVGG